MDNRLYRTNSQSRQIEEAMRRYSRRYNVVGGISYYQRAEVKDIIAYLKLAQSPGDSISLVEKSSFEKAGWSSSVR